MGALLRDRGGEFSRFQQWPTEKGGTSSRRCSSGSCRPSTRIHATEHVDEIMLEPSADTGSLAWPTEPPVPQCIRVEALQGILKPEFVYRAGLDPAAKKS
ncbi:hypothetical protein GCM10028796_30500 [Ramlibacter monticola]